MLAAAPPLFALDTTRELAQYRHDVWQDKDGLPQNSIRAIVQTRDGYLWLGTYEGLVRFDGIRFTVFDAHNTPTLGSSAVQALLEGRDGSLWIGTRHGVTRLQDGVFAAIPLEGLPDHVVWFLFEDRTGSIWVGTEGGALGRLERGRLHRYGKEHGLPASPVSSMTEDRHGQLWIGTLGSGMGLWKDGRFTSYQARGARVVDRVTALFADAAGKFWVHVGPRLLRAEGGRRRVDRGEHRERRRGKRDDPLRGPRRRRLGRHGLGRSGPDAGRRLLHLCSRRGPLPQEGMGTLRGPRGQPLGRYGQRARPLPGGQVPRVDEKGRPPGKVRADGARGSTG